MKTHRFSTHLSEATESHKPFRCRCRMVQFVDVWTGSHQVDQWLNAVPVRRVGFATKKLCCEVVANSQAGDYVRIPHVLVSGQIAARPLL